MNGDQPTRRQFILAAIVSGAVSSALSLSLIRAGSASATATTDGASTLGRSARLLYPHVAVADEVYAEVIHEILSSASSDPQLATVLNEAIAALDAKGDFLELDGKSQLAAMTSVQEQPWFAPLKMQVLTRLYSHPQLWKLIGYPGPSVPFGGYLDRGFDDIDWLPEDAS